MRHWWWKVLGIGLLLYASVMALIVPLSPALVHVSPDRLEAGEQTVELLGYNTQFDKALQTNVYLVNDGQVICGDVLTIEGPDKVRVKFAVPEGFRNELTDLVVHTDHDGALVLYEAFWTGTSGQGVHEVPCGTLPKDAAHEAVTFPLRKILYESIRNLNFHVPMWFTMMFLMGVSVFFSVRFLDKQDPMADLKAEQAVNIGLLFALFGLITGSIWARATWGAWWTRDTQLNGAAATTLIYLAYLVLRGSVPDRMKRGRLAAIYNIFAFVLMVVFFLVLPRLTDSLHPGKGGNPGFNQYDLDDHLRMVFYPAVLGWILFGIWAFTLKVRLARIQHLKEHENLE